MVSLTAGHIKSFHPGIDFADDDDTGNLLAVMTMVDGQFRARRPIGNVSDFLWFVRFPSLDIAHGRRPSFSLRNRSFIVSVTGSIREMKSCVVAVDQSGRKHPVFEFQSDLHTVCPTQSWCYRRRERLARIFIPRAMRCGEARVR